MAKDLLDKWTREEEAKVPNNHAGSILFNLKRARIYRDSGWAVEALENYVAAYEQAGYENNLGLIAFISTEMDELPQG